MRCAQAREKVLAACGRARVRPQATDKLTRSPPGARFMPASQALRAGSRRVACVACRLGAKRASCRFLVRLSICPAYFPAIDARCVRTASFGRKTPAAGCRSASGFRRSAFCRGTTPMHVRSACPIQGSSASRLTALPESLTRTGGFAGAPRAHLCFHQAVGHLSSGPHHLGDRTAATVAERAGQESSLAR
jgi:hypothetical protein